MKNSLINKEKTVAVSGHRYLQKDFDKKRLEEIFIKLIDEYKVDTFLIGMAVGFDTECFKILENLRETRKIKLVACIPCLNQSAKFSDLQKMEYDRMINSADEKIILQKDYDKYCMLKRNDFLVENANILVAYIRKDIGGTAYTVRKAKEKKLNIIKI